MSESKKKKPFNKRLAVIFTAIIAIAGSFYVLWSFNSAKTEFKRVFLQQTKQFATGINIKDIESLKGSTADVDQPQYKRLKEHFQLVKKLFSDSRFIYLIGRNSENKVVSFVDSEVEGSKDESKTGEFYKVYIDRVFSERISIIIPLIEDESGERISALVPVFDSKPDNKVKYILGVDINSENLNILILEKIIPDIFFVIIIIIFVLSSFFLLKIRSKNEAHKEPRLMRYAESMIVLFAGTIFTLFIYNELVKKEASLRKVAFFQAASLKTAIVSEKLNYNKVKLEELARFFESRKVVNDEEFKSCGFLLSDSSAFSAWGYAQVVFSEKKSYPVVHINSVETVPIKQGGNLAEKDLFMAAIEKAYKTGLTTASDSFKYKPDSDARGVFIVKPVKTDNMPGMVFAVVNIDRLIAGSLNKIADEEKTVFISAYDLAFYGVGLFMGSNDLNHSKLPISSLTFSGESIDSLSLKSVLFEYGKTFVLSAEAHKHSFFLPKQKINWIILISGLFFTILLAFLINLMGKGRTILEKKVSERTSELIKSQANLEKITHQLEFVLGATKSGIYIVDINYSLRYVDKKWQEIYGNPSGKKCFKYFRNLNSTCPGCNIARCLEDMQIAVSEQTLPKENGRLVRVHSIPFIDKDGRKVVANFNVDITDVRAAEEQLRQFQKMESIGRLAGGVAHDFNNMLQVITGYAEMGMLQTESDNKNHRIFNEILRAADRSANLTRQLLSFARKDIVQLKIVDTKKAIQEMLKLLKVLVGEGISISFEPQEGLQNVLIDPSHLDQIIANLVVNSRDAIIPKKGDIIIKTRGAGIDYVPAYKKGEITPGQYVVISVIDNGKGMSPDIIKKIYDPFFTTKKQGKGTGLGLSTVFGIVKQNGGFIEVKSEEGKGTSLNIFLPAFSGSPENDVEKNPRLSEDEDLTILIVDDEPMILYMAEELLKEAGFKVFSTIDPLEAINIFSKFNREIDVVLTDVLLPSMNGKELADKLFAIKPDIKVIYMSGHTPDFATQHGLENKEYHFITKPFTSEKLIEKVREILKK